ncbi:AAA family ATPase [Candidatus Daviesbacteria bacterium]|nr:AAA family ATPase [Candidatus Daviesbacteria bacterium]
MSGIFAIEGLDAAGKTTVVTNLKDAGYSVWATPPEAFKKYRPRFEHSRTDIRFLYYLTGVAYAGYQARELSSREPVFFDRYVLTTLAAHEAMGVSPIVLAAAYPLIRSVPIPRKTFVLTCSEEERVRRMHERGANDIDILNMKINNQISEGYLKWAKRLRHPLMMVDTTFDDAQAVTEQVINLTHEL